MITSLTPTEYAELLARMISLVKQKSPLINRETEFFTDDYLKMVLSDVLTKICDYIHHPDRYVAGNPSIQYIWADLVIDVAKGTYYEEHSASSGGATAGVKKEVKIGNATIKYEVDSEQKSPTGHTLDLDGFVKNWKSLLKEYRRII